MPSDDECTPVRAGQDMLGQSRRLPLVPDPGRSGARAGVVDAEAEAEAAEFLFSNDRGHRSGGLWETIFRTVS